MFTVDTVFGPSPTPATRRAAIIDNARDTEDYVISTMLRTGERPDWTASSKAIAMLNDRSRNGAF